VKVSDYIVDFLINKQITDVFGYPGGMVTHLMDSFSKKQNEIKAHVNYNEQGSSFAACGYAQVSLKPGVAYATSGPGATNLITGICNAYFDSIPVIFITGQVNTYESKGDLNVRQKGFQESDIVSMVKNVTKYAVMIYDIKDIRYHLEKAYALSLEGRPGPVLLDIPMNIQRGEIEPELLRSYEPNVAQSKNPEIEIIIEALRKSDRACILAGSGIGQSGTRDIFRTLVNNLRIPVITSMIAIDAIQTSSDYNFGFVGAYGDRYSNFILSKCDLLITLGSRLDTRQTGVNLDIFATNAQLIRIDIDEKELSNKVKDNETQIVGDIKDIIPLLNEAIIGNIGLDSKFNNWVKVCLKIKALLINSDNLNPNRLMQRISLLIPDNSIITTDVGQNQVWTSQSFNVKNEQRILFSGGHGAMGYSLPAAIGAYYAGNGKRIFSINGDGGIQMNIQELQFIARDKLPITIIIFNNRALGMIRHFQEMYFESNYSQTVENLGYEAPNFSLISKAYGLAYYHVEYLEDIQEDMFIGNGPCIIEIILNEETYVFPKLAINKPIQDQDPPIDKELYQYITSL
jgi:acetolactate synthase-1/2/3 large subunit